MRLRWAEDREVASDDYSHVLKTLDNRTASQSSGCDEISPRGMEASLDSAPREMFYCMFCFVFEPRSHYAA